MKMKRVFALVLSIVMVMSALTIIPVSANIGRDYIFRNSFSPIGGPPAPQFNAAQRFTNGIAMMAVGSPTRAIQSGPFWGTTGHQIQGQPVTISFPAAQGSAVAAGTHTITIRRDDGGTAVGLPATRTFSVVAGQPFNATVSPITFTMPSADITLEFVHTFTPHGCTCVHCLSCGCAMQHSDIILSGQGFTGHASWRLYGCGAVVVNGGNIAVWGNSPWELYRHQVRSITFTAPINFVGLPWGSMSGLFADLNNLTSIQGLNQLDTSSVASMDSVFRGTTSLMLLDLSSWDVSRAVTMDYMFTGSGVNRLILGGWNTRRQPSMNNMFTATSSIQQLTLSNNFLVTSPHTTGLPNHTPTGRWQTSTGSHTLTASALMQQYSTNPFTAVWVWRP
jgi:hypothetical protein